MASQQEQFRKGDAAQEKVTTQDPPRSGLVLRAEVIHQEISRSHALAYRNQYLLLP
jgi:hypothetical protein